MTCDVDVRSSLTIDESTCARHNPTVRLQLSLLMIAGLSTIQSDPADACGLKLSKKAVKIAEPIRPSPNPSRILLAGDAPRSLGKVLGQAGHIVSSSEKLDNVREQDFRVVL